MEQISQVIEQMIAISAEELQNLLKSCFFKNLI
jgi:hypothetical protein